MSRLEGQRYLDLGLVLQFERKTGKGQTDCWMLQLSEKHGVCEMVWQVGKSMAAWCMILSFQIAVGL